MTWTEEAARAAVADWVQRNGSVVPTLAEWTPAPDGCPSKYTLFRIFGSWNAAIAAAGLTPNPPYVSNRKDDESWALQLRVDAGATLTELAPELGVTPQALGRRLQRYRARHPEWDHRAPHPGNRR